MKVKDVMSLNVESVSPGTNLVAAANRMARLDIGFLAVLNGDIAGVVTDRDIVVRAIAEAKDPSETTVDEIMTANVETISENDDLEEAANRMEEKQIRRVLVRDEKGAYVGVLSLADLAVKGHKTGLCGEAMEKVCRD